MKEKWHIQGLYPEGEDPEAAEDVDSDMSVAYVGTYKHIHAIRVYGTPHECTQRTISIVNALNNGEA